MKPPIYQRAFDLLIKWLLPSIAFIGSLASFWKNVNEVITPKATYFLTLSSVIAWIIVEVIAKKWGIPWVIDNQKTRLRSLGRGRRIAIIVILFCFWLPRIVSYATHREDSPITTQITKEMIPTLQLVVGGKAIEYDDTREVIYGIPTQLKAPSFITTYIQFELTNISEKTVENVIVSFRYPEGSQVAQTRKMKQDVVGEKEEQQLKRRTSTVEGVTFSYISIDVIGPGKAFILHEPINIPLMMLTSPDTKVTVNVSVSAKDFSPKELKLRLRAITSDSKEELENKYKELIYHEVVENRKRTSSFNYVMQSMNRKPAFASIVFPAIKLAKNSKNEIGYLSDAMHDQWKTFSYNPAPLEYLSPRQRD